MTRLPLIATLLAAAACGDDRGEDLLQPCEYTETPVAWDAAAPDGTVPEDLLATAEGTHALMGTWADGGATTGVTLTIARAGDGATWFGNDSGGCPSYLAIPVSWALATDDGLLDEAGTDDATASDGALGLWAAIGVDAIGGTYAPTVAEGEVTGLEVEVAFGEAAPSGTVYVASQGEDGDTAWAGIDEVLTFGAEAD